MADAAGATPAATGGEQAASAAHHGPVTDGPAPVPAEVRHHASDDGNVDDDGHHRSRDQSPQSKSIPISVKELSDFAQSIQPSGTDLEHYFVCWVRFNIRTESSDRVVLGWPSRSWKAFEMADRDANARQCPATVDLAVDDHGRLVYNNYMCFDLGSSM